MKTKSSQISLWRVCFAVTGLCVVSGGLADAAVYSQDFTSPPFTVPNKGATTFGGGSPTGTFGEWIAGDGNITSNNNTLVTSDTSDTSRSGGVMLDPSLFAATGAGAYSITFDIVSFGPAGSAVPEGGGVSPTAWQDALAMVSVWAGSGYGLGNQGKDVLILNAQAGALQVGDVTGNAVSTLLVSQNYASTSFGTYTLTFNYDGTSAVAVFMGVKSAGWEFPRVVYDNLVINAVPEPSSAALAMLGGLVWGLRRRR